MAVLTAVPLGAAEPGRAGASSAAGRSGSDCRSAGTTVAASRTARLYRVVRGDLNYHYYARATASKRRFTLGRFDSTSCGVRPLALNGSYVAAFDGDCLRPTRGTIRVVNVVTGRTRVVQEEYVELTDLETTAAGTVVWIRSGRDCTDPDPGLCPAGAQVRASERGAATRVLDAGDIEPRTLAIGEPPREPVRPTTRTPVTVYWTSGGQPRSARVR